MWYNDLQQNLAVQYFLWSEAGQERILLEVYPICLRLMRFLFRPTAQIGFKQYFPKQTIKAFHNTILLLYNLSN